MLLTLLQNSHADFTLTLLHTNDVHSRFEQSDKYGGSCTPEEAAQDACFGGVARRYTKIEEIRKSHTNVLLLDAGDQFQGTLWFFYYTGNATKHFMKTLNYEVMVCYIYIYRYIYIYLFIYLFICNIFGKISYYISSFIYLNVTFSI